MTLREGDVVAGWTLEHRLGEGGTSTVWRARKNGEVAVLKTLRPELRDEADWRARLLREAASLRAVAHRNAVALLDAGTTEDDLPFVVMPLVTGESLRATIAREGPLAPARAWALLRPIALALEAAHEAGLVHRDVKPENILLSDPEPKLVDFGLARAHGEGDALPKITTTGAPIGTPAYMAPEQWWNKGVGPAVDQYALGVTLFEALSGRLPFDDASFAELLQAHVSKKPASLADRGARVDAAVERFVARLMSKEPGARFASMGEAITEGDAAFGLRARRGDARSVAMPIFFLAYGALSLLLFGYPRASTFLEWFRGAGMGVFVPIALYVAAGLLLVAWRASYYWALAIAVTGTFATFAGFNAVAYTLARRAPEEAFELFHQGAWEAGANRYLGMLLASALLFAIDAKTRAHAAPATNKQRALSFFSLALASACVTLGVPSAAIPFAALAFEPALGSTVPSAVAVVLASAAATVRAQATCDAVWSLEPTRAARASALAFAMHERTQTFAAAAVASVAAIAIALPAFRALRARSRTRSFRVGLALFAMFAVCDVGLVVRTELEKHAIYTRLGPEFALFSRLDPPRAIDSQGESAGVLSARRPIGVMVAPPLRPTLKLARDRVALDLKPVGLRSVLETDEGLAILRSDLSHRVAEREPITETKDDVDLLLMADASLPPAIVTSALRAAYDVGVRRVGVLFLRGGPMPARALPEEAAYALPRDFGVVRVRLSPDGPRLAGESFGAAADTLIGDQTLGI